MKVGFAYRLNVIVLVAVLVLGAVLGGFLLLEERRAAMDSVERRAEQLGRYLSTGAERALAAGDLEGLDEVLREVVLDPEVAYVVVRDTDGRVLAARWVAESAPKSVSEYGFPLHSTRKVPDAAGPFGGVRPPGAETVAGALAVGFDLGPAQASLRAQVLRATVVILLGALVATLLGTFVLGWILRRSMTPLSAGISRLGAGDLSHRLPMADRNDEIGDIARAVNDMAEKLSTTLVTTSALEAAVITRTRELERALVEQHATRDALAEREERVRLLLESTAEAIYGIDTNGLCTFCNPACLRMLGYSRASDLIGADVHARFHSPPGAGARSDGDCSIVAAGRERRPYHGVGERLWRADGTSFEAELWSHPVLRDGESLGAVVTFLDVTDRRRLEDELLNARKLDSLGVLAGGIAHDFNNLLTGILANISLARHEIGDSAVVGELLEEAEAAAQRSKALTQQLLTFSKGGAPLKQIIALREVVLEAASFAVRGSAVRPVYSWEPDLWAVEADRGQLGQVVQNLVLNAVQAMPAGGTVEVSCANVQLSHSGASPLPPGRYVRVSVRDQGIGIPPEHVSRIFDPYFSTKQGGTGLGLATVYSIVKRHGGHVGVSSRIGEGTTFDIHLPAADRPVEPVVDVDVEPPRGSGRVLVMDDEPVVRRAAESILRRLGYDVVAVADGTEAVEKVRAACAGGSPIDVAVLDLTVPGGLGGADAVEAIHHLDPDLAAVVSSGYSSDPVMASYRNHGFIGVAAKPYTTTDLARAVYDAMQVRRGAAVLPGRVG